MSRALAWLMPALLCLALRAGAQEAAPVAPALGERVVIEDEVLQRWNKISQLELGDRTRAWIEEGRQVLARYRELQALEVKSSGQDLGELNIEVAKLKLTLIHLLRSIEEARLFDMSPEQLRTMQREYEGERAALLARHSLMRDTVLQKGEQFLESYRKDRNLQRFSQRDVVAKLCLQLAELYYARSDEHYFAAQDSLVARAERGLPAGLEPVRDYEDAVRKYQRVIDEFPFSDYMDDALYSVAYIRENSPDAQEVEESRRLYEHLVRDFPSSRYAPEAWMRLGEYWFRQNGEQSIRSAIASYGKILEYPDYPAREKALYKLGWCHYRLQEHDRSVEYFAEAAKYAVRKQQGGEELGADLLDESIAYLAVNYADADWAKANVGELAGLLRSDEELRQSVGFRILDRYGDLFRRETQDFSRAVTAYDSLLALYPLDARAPFIQEKVIDCYAPGALADAQTAYQEKNQLYELYAGAGAWQPDSTEKPKVDELLKRHQVENVGIAMNHAYSSRRRADFDEYLTQSRRYLQSFPQDSASYMIHWNLAKTLETELADHRTAYDEYLTISRGYPERDRRDAAYNAIVLSQTLVDKEVPPPPAAPDSTGARVDGVLTPMEELKKGALENFITLFPQDERAPGYRLLEGKLHYAHQDYDAATALFDSLITSWPQSAEVAEAYQLKLEGLFALGKFQEAEAIARQIQGMALPAEAIARARQRQAESTYSFAEGLKKSEDHLKAAQEFRRMALDVPDAAFADASLFDAASEFTLAGDAAQAAETHLYLAEHYPQSKFADQSLSLAGFIILNDLKDQARAARTFEQLALSYPDSPYAKTAISNASYCYLKTGDWAGAIRLNSLYVERYPQADDAAAVLFDNAGLWLKLNDVAAANAIYADFAARFPGDPRTVQAHVERAEYFTRQQDEPAAHAEYRQAVERNRALQKRGEGGNPLYASRALRKLAGWRFEDYRALALRQPAERLAQDLEAKKAARNGLLADLAELVGLGAGDVFYARYLIAATHDEFARAYREQERPAGRGPQETLTGEVDIQDTSMELSRVAARSYVGTVGELEQVVESLRRQQRELALSRAGLDAWLAAAAQDSSLSGGIPDDSLARQTVLARAADLLDSSLVESTVWTGRSRERVPEVMMATLAVYEQRVDQALALRSQFADDVFLRLADEDKNLLGGLSLQAVQGVLAAYREGLEIIGQVGLDRLWRPRVEQRLRGVVFKLPRAGAAFRAECGLEFDGLVQRFLDVVDKGENYTDRAGLAEEDYASDVLDLADFNKGYALSSLGLTERLLQSLEENGLAGGLAGELSDTLAVQALAYSDQMKRRQGELQAQKADYWKRFEQSSSYVHQDASSTLDDASFFLLQTSKEVLVAAEPVVTRTQAGSPAARRMFVALAELDPAAFGSRFGLSEETLAVRSAPDWRVHRGYEEGFEKPDHDLAAWEQAALVERPVLDALLPEAPVLWRPRAGRTLPADTLTVAAADSSGLLATLLAEGGALLDTLADGRLRVVKPGLVAEAPAGADTLYFRHSFELPGTPVGAQLQLAVDDAFALFFNGEYIDEQAGVTPGGAAGGGETPAPTELKSYALSEFLKTGTNVLAVEVRDRDGSGGGLTLDLQARQIARLTPEMLEAQLQRELEAQRRLDFQRRVSRIDVKNRVD